MHRVVLSEIFERSGHPRPSRYRSSIAGMFSKQIAVVSIVLQILGLYWKLPVVESLVAIPRQRVTMSSALFARRSEHESSASAGTNHRFEIDGSGGFLRERADPVTNTTTTTTTTVKPTPTSKKYHTSLFGRKQNHPTTFEEHPAFKGPLVLPASDSTSDARERIGRYYSKILSSGTTNDDSGSNNAQQQQPPPKQLSPESSTNTILKRVVEQLAYTDAPLDAKEVAESIEFYLRTHKRLLGVSRSRRPQQQQQNPKSTEATTDSVITVQDLCSGHGFTGMLYAACNPPKLRKGRFERIQVVLVDKTEPPSHRVLRDCLSAICPWIRGLDDNNNNNDESDERRNTIRFVEATLEEFATHDSTGEVEPKDSNTLASISSSSSSIVISTHACGSLTDKVIEFCCTSNSHSNSNSNSNAPAKSRSVSALALMPCCYTGTDEGVPYGVRRALGVSMSADVRRCFILQDEGYHVDFATIPSEITPMNRIIVGERRKAQ